MYQSTHFSECQRTERSIPINETNYTYLTRRIGNTNYRVKVCFSQDAEETLEEKVVITEFVYQIRNETALQAEGLQ